jgi:transposase-like protein
MEIRRLPPGIAGKYLLEFRSLDAVLENKDLGISRSTLHRRIIEEAKNAPDWGELYKVKKEQRGGGFVMGIDTSGLKIRGKNYVYLHIADAVSHDPLAYAVCEKEDVATVEPILLRLRNLGYRPRIAVTDLAPELISSIRRVFPCAVIQGCVFHLVRRLNKQLPTIKTVRKVGREKVSLWRKVKDLIRCASVSKDKETRQPFLDELKCLKLDEKARSQVDLFFADLKYYHTMDEDEFKDFGTNILCNNTCERDIGLVKDLKGPMKGFKSLDSARNIIKLFWYCKRMLSENEEDAPVHGLLEEEGPFGYCAPLTFYYGRTNLGMLSKASGIPRELLNKQALKMGLTIIGDFVFDKTQLNDIRNSLLKTGEKSLKAIMQEIGCDQPTTEELLRMFGFKVHYSSFDPSHMTVSFAGPE